jgi:protein-S-isoprenylcysteine O-methyltransferase Ste14
MKYETFWWVAVIWMLMGVVIFGVLFRITAPFGRHTRTDFGPVMNNNLGWLIMEVPSLLTLSYFFFTGTLSPSPLTLFIYGLWALHYVNRSFIYPFRQRNKQKTIPIAIVASGVFFNLINGSLNGYFLGNFANYPAAWWISVPFVAGFILFAAGMYINHRSDHILLNLRKPGESGYKIPTGGMFRYVSCPNLFGEMIEWTGYALLSWNIASLSFAVWTVANLLPRALAHHQWYKNKFADYPASRKAVIPGIL